LSTAPLLLLLLAIQLIPPVYPTYGESTPSLTYYIEVGERANATVTIVFEASGSGEGFLGLPTFEEYTVEVLEGSFEFLSSMGLGVFYKNASFRYSGERVEVEIRYEFPFATLIAEDKAWFMTPLILAPRDFEVTVVVELYGLDPLGGVECWPVEPVEREGTVLEFVIPDPVEMNRVIVEYELEEPVHCAEYEREIGNATVVVRVVEYYKSIADKIFNLLERSRELLEYTFGGMPERIEFEFYLPELNDLSALGYVRERTIEEGIEGPIYLNLALIRFKEGYLEETVIHEYVHLALGLAGVPAKRDIRWFHEGVAEYVAIEVCGEIGIDVTDFVEGHREALKLVREMYGDDLSFVVDWDYESPRIRLYYAAAYYIVNSTAGESGLHFVKKLVEEIEERGGVETIKDVVEAMSSAAGVDLTERFRAWGFDLEKKDRLSELTERARVLIPILRIVAVVLVAMTAIALLISAVILYVVYRTAKA